MRVYVAGAWVERHARAVPAIAQLRSEGVTITHDWTGDPNEISNAVDSDSKLPQEYRLKHAREDYQGVASADALLLLAATERGACGSWVEFGIALGIGIPIIVAGGMMSRTIFTELAVRNFATDGEGVTHLLRYAELFDMVRGHLRRVTP